jgi:hypothetical protein
MKRVALAIVGAAIVFSSAHSQRRPPEIGRQLPDLGPNRVEVRFAFGEKAIECHRFHLIASIEGNVIIDGRFSSGFYLPASAQTLRGKDRLEVKFQCGRYHWHFAKVGERALSPGWWWVGTDFPPFQEAFQGWDDTKDALWIRYLIVDPRAGSGFTVYKFCPTKLKDQKPGPCYDN